MNGIGHTYTDFTSVDIYKKALLVSADTETYYLILWRNADCRFS